MEALSTYAPIPASPDDITPEWLSAVLGPDVVVSSFEVEPVGVGVGIMSLLFRLTPAYASGAGPATVVLKMAPPHEQVRQIAAGYRFYEREVEIYRQLGGELGLRPPRIHHGDYSPETDEFVLVMEDLGHLRSCDQLDGCPPADAELVVTELARHHAHWWEDPRLESLPFIHSPADAPYPEFQDRSTSQAWPATVERFCLSIPPRILALGDRWSEIGPAIMLDAPNHPVTLGHGDVRLDNVFFHDDGGDPVSVIDWQISFANGGAMDVAYFMSQSLTVEDRRAHEADLTRRYHETLLEGGVTDYGFDELWQDYRRSILFCLAYPMTLGVMELVNDRAVALATTMLERSVAAVEDLDADELAPG